MTYRTMMRRHPEEKEYHTLHGRPPDPLPGNPAEKPSREFLDRNNKKVFGA